MNTLHYPDLERCRHLTEIGFPETEECYIMKGYFVKGEYNKRDTSNLTEIKEPFIPTLDQKFSGVIATGTIYCPSVMEMLDVIGLHVIITKKDNHAMVTVEIPGDKPHHFVDTLPNALADLIIWLHKNNYLKF